MRPVTVALTAIVACAGCLIPVPAWAQHAHHGHASGLGAVHFSNTGSPEAQEPFQRGVSLLHSFAYDDAAEAFRTAQEADPACTLAYWLEAFTYSDAVWGEEDLDGLKRQRALDAAYAYARVAPEAEHALHMPFPIFLPVGMWPQTAASNKQAWAASRAGVAQRPNRSVALRGLARAHAAMGDPEGAVQASRRLRDNWQRADPEVWRSAASE